MFSFRFLISLLSPFAVAVVLASPRSSLSLFSLISSVFSFSSFATLSYVLCFLLLLFFQSSGGAVEWWNREVEHCLIRELLLAAAC